MPTALEFNDISKLYHLGRINSQYFSDEFSRWWTMKVRRKEDPLLKVGETNDCSHKGESDYVWALKDINFKVEQGDVVGIIGKNGAGKSTLLKILSQITSPTTGTIKINGRIGSLLEVGTGFHSEMTGRENIFLNGAILGMRRQEIAKKLDEIVDFSGCERYIDTPVKRYSSGMKTRLGFAVAATLDPEILVVDEVLAVGDAEFREKAIDKMRELSRTEGRTVLFVSHSMASVKKLCKTGVVLKNGRMDYIGNIDGAIDHYLMRNQVLEMDAAFPQATVRGGNGALRFQYIRLLSKNGVERSVFEVGEECIIEVGYQATAALKVCNQSRITVSIMSSSTKHVVAWLSSSIFADKIDTNSSTIQFRIPQLMLSEAVYQIKLYAYVDDEAADEIFDAAQLEVLYHDYFGTGKVPIKNVSFVGHTILDYSVSWSGAKSRII